MNVASRGAAIPALRVSAAGKVNVGGANGFDAALSGALDTAAGTAALTISHAGGWRPITGFFACAFVTPEFSGTLRLAPSPAVRVVASAQWSSSLTLVDDAVVITALPASEAPGPSIDVSATQDALGGDSQYKVEISAGLQLGPSAAGVPQLSASGLLASDGPSTLHLSTSTAYVVLPSFTIPALSGTVSFSPDGSVSARAVSAPIAITVVPADIFTLNSFVTDISFESLASSTDSRRLTDEDDCSSGARRHLDEATASFGITVGGRLVVGGAEPVGFAADMTGAIDVAAASRKLSATFVHAGGWTPLAGEAALRTPRFEGSLTVHGHSINLEGAVAWDSPLTIATNILELSAASGAGGPTLHLQLQKSSAGSTPKWTVTLAGGVSVGPPSLALPKLSLRGQVSSSGMSELTATTPSSWTLLPGYLDVSMPGLDGTVRFGPTAGSRYVSVSSTPASGSSLCDGNLHLVGLAGSVVYQTPQDAIKLSASGQVRLGSATDGFLGDVLVQVDGVARSATFSITHEGGHQPFAALPTFITPRIEATLLINQHGKFVDLSCQANAGSPIDLFGVVALTGRGETSGPHFGIELEQVTKGGAVTFGSFFDGKVCVHLDSNNRCLDVHVTATSSGGANTFELSGTYVGGDLTPLHFIPSVGDKAVLRGSDSMPLHVNLKAVSPSSGSSYLEAMLSGELYADLSGLGVGDLVLSFAANARFIEDAGSPRLSGVFVASLLVGPAFVGAGGRLAGLRGALALSLATDDGLNPIAIGSREVTPPRGLAILYRGVSPIPELCESDVSASISLQSWNRMHFNAICEMQKTYNVLSIPSISSVTLTSINIAAILQPAAITFSAGADFQLATGSSSCTDPSTDGECLTASVNIAVSFSTIGVSLGFAFDAQGTWIEPFGLYNFAINDPSLR